MDKLEAIEELKDYGIDIIDNSYEGIKKFKIVLGVEFHDDGSWFLESLDSRTGGCNSDLASGNNLIEILTPLKEYRDMFLKAIKEEKVKPKVKKIRKKVREKSFGEIYWDSIP